MDYNWKSNVSGSVSLGTRTRVADALAPLGISVLEWACLEERLQGVNVELVWSDIQFQGMSLGGMYLPEATLEAVKQAQSDNEKMGLIGFVDHNLALKMVSERECYDVTAVPVESLIGAPILTELGMQAWMIVKETLGYFSGYRFISLLSKSSYGRLMVFHSVFPYNIELLCTECANDELNQTQKKLVQVGPWCQNGRAWLSGWRLICPHMGAALPHEVEASWRNRGL